MLSSLPVSLSPETSHLVSRSLVRINKGIQKLALSFEIAKLREALDICLSRSSFKGDMQDQGFAALPLTQRPGQTEWTENDLSGRFWTRADDRYVEEPREDLVPEKDFSEFNPKFAGAYFEEVHAELADVLLVADLDLVA